MDIKELKEKVKKHNYINDCNYSKQLKKELYSVLQERSKTRLKY